MLQHQFMRNTRAQRRAPTAKFVDRQHGRAHRRQRRALSEVGFANALIAVGTRPHRPDNVPSTSKRVFDSDEMLELDQLPRTLTVIGGGVIGVEYATIFSALDVPVTLIEAAHTILDFVDREIVDDFIHQMRDRGMTIRLGSAVKEIAVEAETASR